jgi:hypothetical protein
MPVRALAFDPGDGAARNHEHGEREREYRSHAREGLKKSPPRRNVTPECFSRGRGPSFFLKIMGSRVRGNDHLPLFQSFPRHCAKLTAPAARRNPT